MHGAEAVIVDAVVGLARALPQQTVMSLAEAISSADWAAGHPVRNGIVRAVPNAPHRHRVAQFLDLWRSSAPEMTSAAVAMALMTAVHADHSRSTPSVELVWTGPDAEVVPLRRTDQVLL